MQVPRVLFATGLAAATSTGCFSGPDLSGLSGPGPDHRVPEIHGRYVGPAWYPLTWSPSGEEVAFVSTDRRVAHAYHLQSGAMRELYAVQTSGEAILAIALSADGAEWFTLTQDLHDTAHARLIRSHTASGSTVLADRAGYSAYLSGAHDLLVAPRGAEAAFRISPDSLYLYRRGSEPTPLGAGCVTIRAFSADESRVLCSAGWPGEPEGALRVFRTDGEGTEVWSLPVQSVRLVRWDEPGIQVVYEECCWRLFVYEQGTGSRRPLGPQLNSGEWPTRLVSWAHDGRKAAYWTTYCAQQRTWLECGVTQAFLYVSDAPFGTATRAAVHTLERHRHVEAVAVSPNSSAVAYVVNGRLYLLDLE